MYPKKHVGYRDLNMQFDLKGNTIMKFALLKTEFFLFYGYFQKKKKDQKRRDERGKY